MGIMQDDPEKDCADAVEDGDDNADGQLPPGAVRECCKKALPQRSCEAVLLRRAAAGERWGRDRNGTFHSVAARVVPALHNEGVDREPSNCEGGDDCGDGDDGRSGARTALENSR
jgi:hypothetical protein